MCRMSSVSSIVSYACCMSKICCAYLEVVLLVCIACMCSLYHVLKFLPVWPMYFSWQLLHFIWYIPLWLYLSVMCFFGWRWFCIVFFVLYAIRMSVFFNNLVMVLVSLPMYVNVHFFMCCVGYHIHGLFFLFVCVYLRWVFVVMEYVFSLLTRYLTAE
jgi:hypothetical protein